MLELTNSLGRKKQVFRPRHNGEVRIFTCGPSIYLRPHIGNYRTFLYEDIVVRYLEYKGHKVKRIINFTDVEDKSIATAHAKHKKVLEYTEDISHHFFKETSCRLSSRARRRPSTRPRRSQDGWSRRAMPTGTTATPTSTR
jgi:cysteinyl-tRNA synthetase